MRKLSIGIAWTGDNTEQVIRDAKIADEAGVDSLFVAETWGHDAFTLLTLLARETRRIKLGTAIVNIYSRSPGALAQHFATLDQLSGGRMLIGLGTSGPNVIEHFHGVKFEKPFTRTREYVEIINLLLRQEKLDYDGEIFKLARGFTLRFTPVRPHIPIWIASITPKSVQQTAAIADGWLPIFLPKARWKEQLGLFADAVRAAGRKPEDVIVRCPYTVTVTDNPERAVAVRRGTAAFYIARMGNFYYEHFVRMGYAEAADAVRKAWAEGGSAAGAAAVPDELVDQLGMTGDVAACCAALDEAAAAGFCCCRSRSANAIRTSALRSSARWSAERAPRERPRSDALLAGPLDALRPAALPAERDHDRNAAGHAVCALTARDRDAHRARVRIERRLERRGFERIGDEQRPTPSRGRTPGRSDRARGSRAP